MKRFLFIVISSFVVAASHAQYVTDVYTATTNEVNDGLNQTKPVTPWGLKNWIGATLPSNVVTNGQEEVHFGPVSIGQEPNTIGVDFISDSALNPQGLGIADGNFRGHWDAFALTNLQSTNLVGVLPMGTLTYSTNVVVGGFLTTDGTNRSYSKNAQYLTNVQDSALSTNVVVYSNSAVSLVSPLNVGSIAAIVVTTTNATSPSGNPSGTYVLSGVANGYFYWAKVGGGFYIWANSAEWNITASINSYSGGQWATTPRLNIPPSGTNWSARNGASGIINVAVSTNMLGAVFGGSAYAGGPVACVQSMTVLGSDTANGGYLAVRNSASPIGPRFILFNQASAQSVVDFYTIGGSQITDNPAFRIAAIDDGASSANLVFKSSINKGTINDLVKIYGANGRMELASTITATNGYILPPKTSATTYAQLGTSNTVVLWGSNNIPQTVYASMYDVNSNRLDTAIAEFMPRWTDALATSGALAPGGAAPTSRAYPGAWPDLSAAYGYSYDNNDVSGFSIQTMHVLATTNAFFPNFYYEPHIHISPNTSFATGTNVTFVMQWQVASVNGTFTNSPTLCVTNTISFTNLQQHAVMSFGNFTNNALQGMSSVLFRGSIRRAAGAAGDIGSSATLSPFVESVDFHIPFRKLGSTSQYSGE